MTLIEGLDKASPRMRVNHNVSWVELRKRVEAATRPVQLDRDEDPVDAVVCAYVALFWYHRPEDVTVYGDFSTGYIVTPTLPPDVSPSRRRRSGPQPDNDELRAQVAHVAALLDEAQRGLTAIRQQLDG
jgi:predicted RNase H-like nuclease